MRALWSRIPFLGQLLVTATTALLVAGAAMLFVAAGQEAAEIRGDLEAELAKELKALPATLAETIVVGDFATLQRTLNNYTARSLIDSVSFQDTTGVVVSSTDASRPPACPAWFFSMFDFSDMQGRVAVVIGGRNYGNLEVRLSATEPAGRAWAHLKSHMAILLLAIFVDFIGIWLVLRNGLLPLRRLEQGATDMAGGRLDIHLAAEGGPEFRRLISAFNRMVDSVRRSQNALRDSEQRLENIIDGTHVGTWEWNVQSGDAVFSERWADIVGYKLDELAPTSIETWIRLVHPDDLKNSGELLDRHFQGELPYYECEARMRHKAGHWVWVLDRGKVFNWTDDHKPLQMAGTHQDITARKASEQALLEAKIAAESANVAKSQFLATMSHEIRTPLNVVLGMAQMLRRTGLGERNRIAYAQTILTSGTTLLRLLTDLLDLAKVEAGKLSLRIEVVSPSAIVREVVDQYIPEAKRKGIDLRLGNAIPFDVLCRADSTRVKQMLANLIGNAVKFTEVGVIDVAVEAIDSGVSELELEFSITDTGIGIAGEDMARLFQPFSQVDATSTRRYGGSGLGLSIVRRLAELMHGTAGGTSEPGKGSRFWFRIRVERAHRDEGRSASEGAPLKAATVDSRLRGHVMVVEDNQDNRELVCALVRGLGLTAHAVNDGVEAVALITAGERFDLVLMDLQMPNVDGYEAARRIWDWQSAHGESRTPVIAVSANAFDAERERCTALGMCDFIVKPIDFSAFEASLRHWLPATNGAVEMGEILPASAAHAGVVDTARVNQLVAELQPMLDENMFDAVAGFFRLADEVRGSSLEPQLDELQKAIACLDLQGAAEALRRFDERWRELKPHASPDAPHHLT